MVRSICQILVIVLFMALVIGTVYGEQQDTKYAEYRGYSIIEKNRRQGLVDSNGNIVIAPDYDLVSFEDCGTIRVITEGRWGLFDCNGKIVLDPVYDYISDHNSSGYAYYVLDGKIGVIYNATLITEPFFDTIPAVISGVNLEFPPSVPSGCGELYFNSLAVNHSSITYKTNYSATRGYDVDMITGTRINADISSYYDYIALLRSIYRGTTWGQQDENGNFTPLTDYTLLDVYPYFKHGITMHDYGSFESGGTVVYMNPYGEVLQAAPMEYDGAWELWDMEW